MKNKKNQVSGELRLDKITIASLSKHEKRIILGGGLINDGQTGAYTSSTIATTIDTQLDDLPLSDRITIY